MTHGEPFGPRSRAAHRARILGLGLLVGIAIAGCAKKVEPPTQPDGITFTNLGDWRCYTLRTQAAGQVLNGHP